MSLAIQCQQLFTTKLTIKNCLNQCQQAVAIHVTLNQCQAIAIYVTLNQCQAIAIYVSINGIVLLQLLGSMQFYLLQPKENNILMAPIFLVPISEFLFKFKPQLDSSLPSITIADEFRFLFADKFCFLFIAMCWVSSLSSMISKFHFSLYLHSKLDILFLLLLFLSLSPF